MPLSSVEALASKVTAVPTVVVLSAPAFVMGGLSTAAEPFVIVNLGFCAAFDTSEL